MSDVNTKWWCKHAGLDAETDEGETALEGAVRARQPGAISILLLHGAKIKAEYAPCNSHMQ